MQKDFDKWNQIKKHVHEREEGPFYREREIWWCALGLNVGYEQDGSGDEYTRPVLVLRVFSRKTCLIVPLTTSQEQHPMRIPIGLISGKHANAILSQIRIIDTRRFVSRLEILDKSRYEQIRKKVKELL